MRGSRAIGALAITASALLLTACGAAAPETTVTTTGRPASSTPAPTASTTDSASAAAGTPAPTASTTRTDPNAPAGQCTDAHLAVSVQDDPTGSGAGQRLSYVVFRNTGSSTCVLRGAPGVSLVGDGNGTQIGAAAAREASGPTVSIPAGSSALAALSYPDIDEHGGAYGDGTGKDPQCEAKAVDGYRVYPPHSFRASFTRVADLYGCSTDLQTLHVSAVEPASKYADFTPKP